MAMTTQLRRCTFFRVLLARQTRQNSSPKEACSRWQAAKWEVSLKVISCQPNGWAWIMLSAALFRMSFLLYSEGAIPKT